MNPTVEVMQTDVLVIGSGLAGARATIEAHDQKARVMMVAKARFGLGGASGFPDWTGGYNMPNGHTDPMDSPDEELGDILQTAAGMCVETLAKIVAYESEDRLHDLERWGLDTIIKVEGKYSQTRACFSTRPRLIKTASLGTAPSMLAVLKRQIKKRMIEVIDDVMITRLLTHRGSCVGALGVNKYGQFLVFRAKSTVLATGGAGALFHLTRYPLDATGDGYALGFHAGAELFNMEFIQIMLGGMNVVLWLLHPNVYNGLGEIFLPKYLPYGVSSEECYNQRASHHPFSVADNGKYLDIAVYKEVMKGRGTENTAIYADFTNISEEYLEKAIEATNGGIFGGVEAGLTKLRAGGVNILKTPLEITPRAHGFNGGLRIDERTETTLHGLYAAGETAGGPHGADRLGGNMIAACQVFGARAGRFAAEKAISLGEVMIDQTQVDEEISRVSKILERGFGISPQEIEGKIKYAMTRNCLTVRNQKGLERCIEELRRLRNEELPKLSLEGGADLFRALAIPNLLDVGGIIAYASLHRRESRGAHYREDYPARDDQNWLRTVNIRKQDLCH